MADQIDEGVQIGGGNDLADLGVGITTADCGEVAAPAAAAESDVGLLGRALGHVLLLCRAGVDQGDEGVGVRGLDADVAQHCAEAPQASAKAAETEVAAARVSVGGHDVGNDDVVGRHHLALAEVLAALQLAGIAQIPLGLPHLQRCAPGHHPQAIGPPGEQLQEGLGIGEAERGPPVAVRLLDSHGPDRAGALRQIRRPCRLPAVGAIWSGRC